MRPSQVSLALAVVASAVVLASPSAEAANRRRVPRGAGGQGAAVRTLAVRSDEAIAALLATAPAGATISLPPGRFHAAFVIDRPLRVVGSPFGTSLEAFAADGRPVVTVAAGVADVTIEGLTLVGGAPASLHALGGNDRLAIRRVGVEAASGEGIRVDGTSSGVVVERSTLDRCGGAGLVVAAHGAALSRLEVRPGGGPGAVLRGEDVAIESSSFDGGAEGVVFEGLRASVARSTFRGVAVAARFAGASDTCTFRRNDVRGASNGAVADAGSIYALVAENRIAGTASDAVRLLGSWHTVSANVISGAGGDAVVGAGTSLRVADNRLESPAGDAVALVGDGNMVDSNAIVSPGGAAVAVEGDANVLALNDCDHVGADAIVLAGAENRLVGNVVEGAGAEGIRVLGDANTLQGNDVRDTAGHGLHVAGGAANVLDSNHLTACGGAGFLDEGVATVLRKNRVD
jgi:hypothetical protein